VTPHQILVVAVRIFAIVWLLNSIGHLLAILRYSDTSEPYSWTAISLMWPILELIGCVFLWFFPATLSRRLLRDTSKPEGAPGPKLSEWQSMIVIGVGLWTLSYAVPDVVYWIIHIGGYLRQGAEL
jgi:hypothetical protein